MSDPRSGSTRDLLIQLRKRRPGLGVGWIVAAVLAALSAGLLAGPAEVSPTQVGAVTHWGGWALETAFVGAVLVACVATFRVVELLFRANDAPALRTLPLAGGAVGRDRLLAVASESAAGLALVACFVAPTLVRSDPEYAVVTLGFLAAAGLLVPLVGFGVVVSAMVATVDPDAIASKLTGGTLDRRGAVHHLSPGAAFGAVASLLLLLKLGSEEPLRVWSESGGLAMTNAGWIGIGIPVLTALGIGAIALRDFATNFHEVQASLFDAEVPPPDTGYEYFRNEEKRDRLEAFARPLMSALYRKDRLQVARSSPFLFPSTLFVSIVAAFSLWASRGTVVRPGTVGILLGLWLVVVVAPKRRLARLPGEETYGLAAMLADASSRVGARRLAASSVAARHAIPLSVVALVAGGDAVHVLAGILAGVVALLVGLEARTEAVSWAAFALLAGAASASFAAASGLGTILATIGLGCVAIGLFVTRTLLPVRPAGTAS